MHLRWIDTEQFLTAGRQLSNIASVCAICGAWPAQTFCATCTSRFARAEPRCQRCAARLPPALQAEAGTVCSACRLRPPPLDRCVAAVAWGWPWNDFIARFKFGHDPGWARPLAGLLAAHADVQTALREIDWLLPLPLAPERLRERGFNQSLLLARRLSGRKTEATLLRRVRHSAPQASLDRAARLRNVRGAFQLDPAQLARVPGRHLCLIDDVMSTGATLFEAAHVLRAAGAARITALVLARNDEAPAYGAQASHAAAGNPRSRGG